MRLSVIPGIRWWIRRPSFEDVEAVLTNGIVNFVHSLSDSGLIGGSPPNDYVSYIHYKVEIHTWNGWPNSVTYRVFGRWLGVG